MPHRANNVLDFTAHRAALRSLERRFAEWAAARQRREDRAAGQLAPADVVSLPPRPGRVEEHSGRAA
jgi:hypothetical protein